MLGCVPILQELQKKKPKNRGYRHKTSGRAEYYLHLLRNYPCGRAIGLLHCRSILRICQISPESLDDEGLARVMAVATIIDNLAIGFTDETCKRLQPVFHEADKAHTLHARLGELAKFYDDDITRHVDKGLGHLEAVWSAVTRDAVCYVGRQLEQDFGGLRAARRVTELVNHTFARPKLTEPQVRYLCGWIKGRAPEPVASSDP